MRVYQAIEPPHDDRRAVRGRPRARGHLARRQPALLPRDRRARARPASACRCRAASTARRTSTSRRASPTVAQPPERLLHLTVSLPFIPAALCPGDRAVERVLARLQRHAAASTSCPGDTIFPTLLDAVALNGDPVRDARTTRGSVISIVTLPAFALSFAFVELQVAARVGLRRFSVCLAACGASAPSRPPPPIAASASRRPPQRTPAPQALRSCSRPPLGSTTLRAPAPQLVRSVRCGDAPRRRRGRHLHGRRAARRASGS